MFLCTNIRCVLPSVGRCGMRNVAANWMRGCSNKNKPQIFSATSSSLTHIHRLRYWLVNKREKGVGVRGRGSCCRRRVPIPISFRFPMDGQSQRQNGREKGSFSFPPPTAISHVPIVGCLLLPSCHSATGIGDWMLLGWGR